MGNVLRVICVDCGKEVVSWPDHVCPAQQEKCISPVLSQLHNAQEALKAGDTGSCSAALGKAIKLAEEKFMSSSSFTDLITELERAWEASLVIQGMHMSPMLSSAIVKVIRHQHPVT